MQIKIESYKEITDSKIKGFAQICILIDDHHDFTIKDVKVITSPHGGVFYAFPSREYTNKDGETKFYSTAGFFTKEGSKDFQEAMNTAFKQYFKDKAEAPPVPAQIPEQPSFNTSFPDDGCPF